ncbi:oriC-binding nucleoid-associated protein [Salmonella enterica subsp. enterica serovar Johannesburg str. SA20025782]|nr:oriC-binding nucleoid-associated protein [Salmonella enterica subsp. enterica serovar Johannesburg str. SA20025782]
MTVQDYLLKFRKISSLESLEKLFDHLNYTLTDDMDIVNMYRAADHRRAELVSGGRLFDVGQVPQSVWRYVTIKKVAFNIKNLIIFAPK